MAKLSRKKGTVSQIFHIFIQDSSATTGAGLTGLLFNSAGLACKYINAGAALSGVITLQDITTLGTYEAPTANTNIRFKEVSSASPSQGIYEIHIHNDWMNLTGGSLIIMLAGATNMAQFRLEIDLQADANMTHVAGTAQTAGDLATMITAVDDLVDTEVAAIKSDTAAILVDTGTTLDGRIPAALTVNGNMKCSLMEILTTALTETAGQIAAAFKQFFDVGTPTGTMKAITNVVTATNLTTNNDKTGYSIGVGGIASTAFAAGAIDAAACAADFITASEFAASAAEKIADAILNRNIAGGSNTGRLVKEALYLLRNKAAIATGTLTVYQTDDVTSQWTAAVATTPGNPISSVDPV